MEEKPRSVEEGGGCFYSYRSEDGPRRDCGYQADSCTLTRGANKGEIHKRSQVAICKATTQSDSDNNFCSST